MVILIERDLAMPSLLSLEGMRELEVVEKVYVKYEDGVRVDEKSYEVRAHFDSVDDEENHHRLAAYSERKYAEMFYEQIWQCIARAGHKGWTAVVIGKLTAEKACELLEREGQNNE